MSVGFSVDSIGETSYSPEDIKTSLSRWFGRDLSYGGPARLVSFAARRIVDLISFKEYPCKLLAFQLAWLKSSPQKRPLIQKQIAILIRKANGWTVQEGRGWGKKLSKGWKSCWNKTCDFAADAWKATCDVAQKTCETVQEFWEEHKKEIIIGACVAATVAAVVAVSVSTGGTGTQAAVAGGAVLLNTLGGDTPEEKRKSYPFSSPFPQPSPAGVSLGENLCPLFFDRDQIEAAPLVATPSFKEIPLSSQIIPDPIPIPEAPPYQTPYPQINLEALYGKTYVSQIYTQFGLTDPYRDPLSSKERPSPNRPFTERIEPQQTETPALNYTQQLLPKESRPSPNQQFVELIESKLKEVHAPDYLNNLEAKKPKHSSHIFRNLSQGVLGVVLREIEEAKSAATLQTIETKYPKRQDVPITDNYAFLLASQKPAAPFREVPLLGYADQSTIHFHCGINNDFSSIVGGGMQLSETLDRAFAVQPHLLHASSIITGLTFVGLEQLEMRLKDISILGIKELNPLAFELPGFVLGNSHIQRSIDYEVESLSKIAESILAKGNPKLKQVHVTFSNGGHVFKEALKRLSPEHRQTIVVITTGTTTIIEDYLACEIYNVIGDKDWPSKICNGGLSGIEAAKDRGATVYPIPQNETQLGIGGHYFTQPDYQKIILGLISDDITKNYEIY